MTTVVEVRCPVGPKKLFTKLRLGEEVARITPFNLIEFSCSDCAKRLSRFKEKRVGVYHSFNFAGELISTRVEDLA